MADQLTVIILAVAGEEALRACIEAVCAQTSTILVIHSDGAIEDAGGRAVGAARDINIPEKRRAGLELASTPLVALVEDTVCPCDGWVSAVEAAFGNSAVMGCGGPVHLSADLPPSARALALADFGKFGGSRPAAAVSVLPGCNFAFRREVVLKAAGSEGIVDQIVFERLRSNGGVLSWVPAMRANLCHPDASGARLRSRFDHGRIYAGLSQPRSAVRRAAAAAKSLLLPPFLTARSLMQPGAREHLSLPMVGWLALQQTAWAAGEFTGAVFGLPEEGCNGWR